MRVKSPLLTGILLCCCLYCSAQTWELGVFGGGAGYMGDLNPVKPYKLNNLAFGGMIQYNFNAIWGLKLGITHGKIQAADSLSDNAQYRQRNLSFYSPITEASLQLVFNFFEYVPSMSRKIYTPYLFVGVGGVFFNPKTRMDGREYELRYLGTEGQSVENPYRNYTLTVPYGLGIKYNIAGKWSLSGEIGYRTAYTDYLDDVSGRYPTADLLSTAPQLTAIRKKLSDPSVNHIGAPLTQRGDFRKRDTYFFTVIGITYTFVTQKCPVVN
ncbi:outer membrane beta-barrel protein [Pedobacter sp. BS3]|uniref:type IX secretion system protein PorG n=1 Tax=Pedobacter sp. BS3 TaxID=2567937 RepID=UPI0011ECE96C|nr:DUF6089 family protein [Pedobacter sp. BS3]TZF84878.1 outer membrane beta-barrel protein [Pedobacter sp. BS3]